MIPIDKISSISVEDFYLKYLGKNIPCIFKDIFTKNWECIKSWKDNANVSFEKIFQFNDLLDLVNVADCKKFYFDSHLKLEMCIKDFMLYWENFHKGSDERLLYLKDWHYFLNKPDTLKLFVLLPYFKRDWLNEFWDIRSDVFDDYRFVYFGVKGTWTGLHFDVFKSYSWSANIFGTKRWLMFPPGFDFTNLGVQDTIISVSDLKNQPYMEIIQEEGEIVFVPSGWYHQVENITDCLSINHNWLNGFNINMSWNHLCQQLDDVERETKEVKDTPGYIEECQVCLKAYSGINFEEFIAMVEFIIYKRLKKILNYHGLLIQEISESDSLEISMMRAFFQNIFLSLPNDWHRRIEWDQQDFRLDLIDIKSGFNVLQIISDDVRCQTLHLISNQLRTFISESLFFIETIK